MTKLMCRSMTAELPQPQGQHLCLPVLKQQCATWPIRTLLYIGMMGRACDVQTMQTPHTLLQHRHYQARVPERTIAAPQPQSKAMHGSTGRPS
jgi:hypothetical protein